jgi:hypothetical protein
MWSDYTVSGGTYCGNLLITPGHPGVPDGHPAAQFKYSLLKEKYAKENEDIVFDRREVAAPQTVQVQSAVAESKTNGISESVAEIKVGA